MNCIKCGKELKEDMVFCPYCGERLIQNVIDIPEEKKEEVKETGPWKVFARFGSVLGKVSISTFWIIGAGLTCGIFGIVCSSLGRKSKNYSNIAAVGFKRSLLASILALAFLSLITLIKFVIDYFD